MIHVPNVYNRKHFRSHEHRMYTKFTLDSMTKRVKTRRQNKLHTFHTHPCTYLSCLSVPHYYDENKPEKMCFTLLSNTESVVIILKFWHWRILFKIPALCNNSYELARRKKKQLLNISRMWQYTHTHIDTRCPSKMKKYCLAIVYLFGFLFHFFSFPFWLSLSLSHSFNHCVLVLVYFMWVRKYISYHFIFIYFSICVVDVVVVVVVVVVVSSAQTCCWLMISSCTYRTHDFDRSRLDLAISIGP